jgi:hypothetical protein
MKILYIKHGMHLKNHNSMMSYKNITLYVIENPDILNKMDLTGFDCVYSPQIPIDVNKYPNTKFIFGPHFSVFPEKQHMDLIRRDNVTYVQPSTWVVDLWKSFPICNNIKIKPLPFGVDTNKFNNIKPITERNNVMIYFKHRNPTDLVLIEKYMKTKSINYTVFSYDNKYHENDYINYLQNTKFCIWVDAHESQGFALEEALSCDVPLMVWNVTSLNQEYGSKYPNTYATTIPYWDERCGEFFYNIKEIDIVFNLFISRLETYKPREYILENLSMDKCEEKLINIINSI